MTAPEPAPDQETHSSKGLTRSFALPTVVWGLIAVCVLIELGLLVTDLADLGGPRLRRVAYEYFGFWPGLLRDWTPNYPAQKFAMFLTYGFLHGGILHLTVNMITLGSLGRAVVDRVGSLRFAALYVASILGGALGFGLLADTLQPMVGASGALFGLAGALLAWNYVDRFTMDAGLWPVAQAVAMLIGLNILLWWVMDGHLAWETHLGGFICGWITALLLDPRGQDF